MYIVERNTLMNMYTLKHSKKTDSSYWMKGSKRISKHERHNKKERQHNIKIFHLQPL